MSSYTVLGVDRATKRERVVVVEAGDDDQAAESAMDQGLCEIKGVRKFDQAASASSSSPKAWYEDRSKASKVIARAVGKGVFFGMCLFAIVLAIVLVAFNVALPTSHVR